MDENAQEQPREAHGTGQESDARDIPIPPANFEFMVLSLRSQADLHLGLLHFGDEKDRPKPNLPLARHAIDLLAMLEEKTRGNLSIEEARLLENSLTELRFRFVQINEEVSRKKGESKAEDQGSTADES